MSSGKPIKINALQRLAEVIAREVKTLRGQICVGPATRDHKLKFPSLAIVPTRFSFQPDQADENDYVRNEVRSFGPQTAVFEVGTWEGVIELRLGEKTPFKRYELEHCIEQVFLGNADGTAPDAWDYAGTDYMRPGVILIDVPECDNARCAFEMEDDTWENERVFANEWYSVMRITARIPALVRAKCMPDITELLLSLTQDLETIIDTPDDTDALTDIETVVVDEEGNTSVWVPPALPLLDLDFTGTTLPTEVDTYFRASTASPITGVGVNGVEVTTFANNVFAYAYRAGFTHVNKTGAIIEPTATNLHADSDVRFSANGGTVVNNAATAPNGNTVASTVTTSSAGRGFRHGQNAVTASAQYVWSTFLRANGGPTENVTIRVRDTFNGSTIYAQQAIQITDKWARYELPFVPSVATASCEVVTDAAGSFEVAHGQLETGAEATSWIPTSGSTASRATTDLRISSALSKGYIDLTQGQIDTVLITDREKDNDFFFSVAEGFNVTDAKVFRNFSDDADWYSYTAFDAVVGDAYPYGTTGLNHLPKDVKHVCSLSWDSSATPSLVADVDGNQGTAGAPYSVGTADVDINIGKGLGSATYGASVFASFRVWGAPQ